MRTRIGACAMGLAAAVAVLLAVAGSSWAQVAGLFYAEEKKGDRSEFLRKAEAELKRRPTSRMLFLD